MVGAGLIESKKKPQYHPTLIVSAHGIRSHAPWQKAFAAVFSGGKTRVASYDYGRYGLLKFLNPFCNRRMIDHFYTWYGRLVEADPSINLNDARKRHSIAAHSFGSWIVCYSMLKHSDIKFDKIILCGSILPSDFEWSILFARDQIGAVRNECGLKDPWPKWAGALIARAGTGGSHGFNWFDSSVQNIKCDDFGHSDFLLEQHMRKHWLPFLYQSPQRLHLVNGRQIESKEEFSAILDCAGTILDVEAFGKIPHYDEAELPQGLSLEWSKINPDIYTFLMEQSSQKPAGYINAMPVSDALYTEIRNGNAVDNAVTAADIVPFSENRTVKIYLMSIVIGESYRNFGEGLFHRVFVKLTTGFVEKLVHYAVYHQVFASHLIAVAWTPAGERLCEYLSMVCVGRDRYNNAIYELDIRAVLSSADPVPQVLRRLKSAYRDMEHAQVGAKANA
ncbi:hypothetical protein [Azospirillum sp.]|uniref:hypothetical protein n=1 Tax=Azospirillum sp. TaxID=34012 RepID=UPI003D7522DF